MSLKYITSINDFNKIPGNIMVYWVGDGIFNIYKKSKPISSFCYPKQGIAASGNDLFLRRWYEVEINKICLIREPFYDYYKSTFDYKWFMYSKGGDFRKWYGNEEYVIDYYHDGKNIKNHKGSVIRNPNFYYKECISWSDISSSKISFKYKDFGHIFDAAGPSIIFSNHSEMNYTFALLNSVVIQVISKYMSPSLHFSVGQVAEYPFIKDCDKETDSKINQMVEDNKQISRKDWDSFETSWDFKKHPLL